MATLTYVKYQIGTEVLAEAANAGTDAWRLILSNTAPTVATDTTAQGGVSGGILPRMRARKKRLQDDEDVMFILH